MDPKEEKENEEIWEDQYLGDKIGNCGKCSKGLRYGSKYKKVVVHHLDENTGAVSVIFFCIDCKEILDPILGSNG